MPTTVSSTSDLGWVLGPELESGPVLRVYRARQLHEGRVLRRGRVLLVHEPRYHHHALERQQRLAQLRHPLVRVPEALGELEGHPYALESSSGLPTLSTLLRQEVPPHADQVLEIGVQLVAIVAGLHGLGLVHGGLDLQSVFRAGEELRVGELGPVLRGHWFAHAAPEVARGGLPTPQSDLFGVGYILASLLQGGPLDGAGFHPGWRKTEQGPVVQLRGQHPLIDVLHLLLDREPSRRPASAGALLSKLARLRRVEPPRRRQGLAGALLRR